MNTIVIWCPPDISWFINHEITPMFILVRYIYHIFLATTISVRPRFEPACDRLGAPSCMKNPSCWILSTARSAEKPQRWLRSKPGKLVEILHSALQSCVLVRNCVSLLCPDLQLSTIDMCKLPFATVYHHASCLQNFVIRHHIVSKVFIFNYLPSYAIICPCSFFKNMLWS